MRTLVLFLTLVGTGTVMLGTVWSGRLWLVLIASERLTMWPVSKALGNVKYEGPELVERVTGIE